MVNTDADARAAPRSLLRLAVCGVLLWQAVVTVIGIVERCQRRDGVSWQQQLCTDTPTRLRHAMGPDAEIAAVLPTLMRPGSVALNRTVPGTLEELRQRASSEQELIAMLGQLAAKNAVFVQLTGLLYPDPFFLSVAEPITAVEDYDGPDQRPWLFVLAGDSTPAGRPGWALVHHHPRFELWRFQQD